MSQESRPGRRHRHGSGLWQGAAVVVAAATLVASSQVADAGRPAASARQDPPPAGVETSTTPAGSSAATPSAAPDTPASPASPSAPSPSSSAAAAASGLAAGGIPSVARAAYDSAAAAAPGDCGITWSLVAAIGRVESNHGRFAGAVLQTDGRSAPRIIGIPLDGTGTALIRDTDGGRLDGDTVHDRAVGPMQFIPSTWARYASDGDGDGSSDPFDIQDAARATARYLCAAGGDLTTVSGQRRAVLAYNLSDSYVATVLTLAAQYAGTPAPTVPTDPVPLPSEPPANPGPPPAVEPVVSPSPSAVPSPSPLPTPSPGTTPSTVTTPPPTTTPPSTTPPPTTPPPTTPPPTVTTPPSTPPSTTPPPTTTPTTTPPVPTTPPTVTTPPSTTPPTTTPPSTTPPSTPPSTPPTTTTPPATTTPSTPAPTTTPGCTTPAVASLGTVDIRDGSADPSVSTAVGARVAEAGGTVGDVSTTQDTTSGVLYPESQAEPATALADALGLTGAARVGDVQRVTVVIGAGDAARLACAG
jgi:membrane-bound lytic murein transglycosylase B